MSRQKEPRNNDMNTTVFLLLFCILNAHCATYKTQDENLSRMIRSPHYTKSASGDSPIAFRTQNWSGVARGANGAQGVFSGAAAAAANAAPAADEAFSIAASGDAPVKDKLEERFGGSDHSDLHYITFNPAPPNFYNPYIPDHHGNDQWGHGVHNNFYRGLIGDPRGGYNYGQLNTGAHSQAFAKSEASSNAASGCDDMTQNYLSGNGQRSTNTLTKSQAFSNAGSGFGDTTHNSGQFSSNTFSENQAKSFSLPNGQSNGGYGSGLYNSQSQVQPAFNAGSNGNLQTTAESKTFNLKSKSESFSSGVQQSKSFGNGFSNFKGLEYNGGQQVYAQDTGFGSSQDLAKGSGQQVESQGDVFGSSQGSLNGGSQQVASHGNEFASSQGLQNGGGQQVDSYNNGYSSTHSFRNAGKDKAKYHSNSNGFGSDQSKEASFEIDHNSHNDYGSQLSKGFEVGTGSDNGNVQTNYNRQDTSSVSGSKTFGGGFTGHGQINAYGRGSGSSKYQSEGTLGGIEAGGFTGQSSDSEGILTNNANSNGQQSLSSSSAASGHEDLQSTLSGALGLASQGLQASQNQPCSTCQKSSYAFSNAKSHSGSAVALSIGG